MPAMFRCGKTSQTAIACASLLAECYDAGKTRLSSPEIAKRRELPAPLVAKVLTVLSTAGIVDGTRGPGGGYWLSRNPETISLAQIVAAFEKEQDRMLCPFGPNWCGHNDPCPMHDSIVEMDRQWTDYLRSTNLAVFAKPQQA